MNAGKANVHKCSNVMVIKMYQSLSKLFIYFHMVQFGKSVIFIGSWQFGNRK